MEGLTPQLCHSKHTFGWLASVSLDSSLQFREHKGLMGSPGCGHSIVNHVARVKTRANRIVMRGHNAAFLISSGDSRETSMHSCLSITGPACVLCGMLFVSMQGWVIPGIPLAMTPLNRTPGLSICCAAILHDCKIRADSENRRQPLKARSSGARCMLVKEGRCLCACTAYGAFRGMYACT